jgi:hypothetical protein
MQRYKIHFGIVVLLIVISACVLWGQSQGPVLSSSPTLIELQRLYLQVGVGTFDLADAQTIVVERGSSAVAGLAEVLNLTAIDDALFTEAQTKKKTLTKQQALFTVQFFAVGALRAIGTDKVWTLLFQCAASHPDKQLRAEALRAYGTGYYERTIEKKTTPDKEIIHLLMRNADDTTFVVSYQHSLGAIARDGLKKWTNKDFGDVDTKGKKVAWGRNKEQVTLAEYRERWWQQNGHKVVWKIATGLFEF